MLFKIEPIGPEAQKSAEMGGGRRIGMGCSPLVPSLRKRRIGHRLSPIGRCEESMVITSSTLEMEMERMTETETVERKTEKMKNNEAK